MVQEGTMVSWQKTETHNTDGQLLYCNSLYIHKQQLNYYKFMMVLYLRVISPTLYAGHCSNKISINDGLLPQKAPEW